MRERAVFTTAMSSMSIAVAAQTTASVQRLIVVRDVAAFIGATTVPLRSRQVHAASRTRWVERAPGPQ
jgi:hypothetical protein